MATAGSLSGLPQLPPNTNLSAKSPSQTDIAAELRLTPILNKLEEFRSQILSGTAIDATTISNFFNTLGENLRKDPEIGEIIKKIETSYPSLVSNWKEGKSWIASGIRNAPDVDSGRREIVRLVIQIVDMLCKREGISESKFVYLGTPGPKSDMDVTIFPTEDTSKTPYSTHTLLGVKAGMTSIIWQALFNGTSHDQADTDFYPPQIGAYLEDEIKTPEAQKILSRATISTLLLQSNQCMEEKDWKNYTDTILKEVPAEAQIEIKAIIEDIEVLQKSIENIENKVPKEYTTILPAIFTLSLSRALVEAGKNIETLPKGSPEREASVAKFYLLASLRERFLPEGYMSKGAYLNVCRNTGGQLSQRVDETRDMFRSANLTSFIEDLKNIKITNLDIDGIEKEFLNSIGKLESLKNLPDSVKKEIFKRAGDWFTNWKSASNNYPDTKQLVAGFADTIINLSYGLPHFPENSSIDLLESSIENLAYFFHREDPIDASKYGKRFYESALDLVDRLIQQGNNQELEQLNERLAKGLATMNMLESAKREKIDENSFITTVEDAFRIQKVYILKALWNTNSQRLKVKANQQTVTEIVDSFSESLKTNLVSLYNETTPVDTQKKINPKDIFQLDHGDYLKDPAIKPFLGTKALTSKEQDQIWELLSNITMKNFILKQENMEKTLNQIAKKHFEAAQPGKPKTFEPLGEARGQLFISELINKINIIGYKDKEKIYTLNPILNGLMAFLDKEKTSAEGLLLINAQKREAEEYIMHTSPEELKHAMIEEAAELFKASTERGILPPPIIEDEKSISFNEKFTSTL